MCLISVLVSNIILAPLAQAIAASLRQPRPFVGNLLPYVAIPVWCILFLPLSTVGSTAQDDSPLLAFLALLGQRHTHLPMGHHSLLGALVRVLWVNVTIVAESDSNVVCRLTSLYDSAR